MDKNKVLDEIFANDPFGVLDLMATKSPVRTEDERLVASFEKINEFYKKNNREPQPNTGNIHEFKLYARLKALRDSEDKKKRLENYDKYDFLKAKKKEHNSVDDILSDDETGILQSDDFDIFDLKHVKGSRETAKADFVARRKPCKDFHKYEQMFKDCQEDLALGKRKLVEFREKKIKEGIFCVLNGVLLYVEKIINPKKDKSSKIDGRTRLIFENGTESNMLFRSLGKGLYQNGKLVTHNIEDDNKKVFDNFNGIVDEDEEVGFIYILQSLSDDPEISSIGNLYKIGYSKGAIKERVKNAEQKPTYLMAPVKIVVVFQCYNMNPQKLEQLLHNFFGTSCLNVDVFDVEGNRHTPREWFIAPIKVIEQAVEMIVRGSIINYRYDSANESIVLR